MENAQELAIATELENASASELTTNEDPQFGSKKLSEMTGPEMLELQHEMVSTAKDLGMDGSDCQPRKVWRNKADGVRTVLALHKRIEAHRAGATHSNGKAPEPISPGLRRLRANKDADKIRTQVVEDGDTALKKVKKERTATAKEKVAKEKKKGGRPGANYEQMTIKVLHEGPNPKRANAAKRYSYYRDGMPVTEYIAQVQDRGLALADIRWDVKQGWIKVV